MNPIIKDVLENFNFDCDAKPFGNGHINDTYLTDSDPRYILQRINKNAFPIPENVMDNIVGVTAHIEKKVMEEGGDTSRATLRMIKSKQGTYYYKNESGEYFRAYRFIGGVKSHTDEITPDVLYQSAKAFGNFQRLLEDYPAEKLHETIVDFHNTPVRYQQFKEALKNDKAGRASSVEEEIRFVLDREADGSVVVDLLKAGDIPLRVTHNDTKLNNVLLDEITGEGVCIIDLDTVMPGSLLYDFGDALRFGGSTGAEDETDLSKIWFDTSKFEAFARGFIEALPSITPKELELLPFSVKLMTLECGMRFLADYLNGDVYFKTQYPEHNLVRARTQFKLISDIERKMDELKYIIRKICE